MVTRDNNIRTSPSTRFGQRIEGERYAFILESHDHLRSIGRQPSDPPRYADRHRRGKPKIRTGGGGGAGRRKDTKTGKRRKDGGGKGFKNRISRKEREENGARNTSVVGSAQAST